MQPSRAKGGKILRFNFRERAVHWAAALCFLYTTLTGLSLWSPRLFWLSGVFGGGDTVRAWHPWGGILFTVALGCMFSIWSRQMGLDAADRTWLRNAHRYAVHDETDLPDSGRFNAGQKVLFWLQSGSTVLLLVTGVILWFPSAVPRRLLLAAVLVHPPAAILSIGAIIVHIYMGTAAVPGAFRGMIEGWVRPGWAESHHRKWHREISKH